MTKIIITKQTIEAGLSHPYPQSLEARAIACGLPGGWIDHQYCNVANGPKCAYHTPFVLFRIAHLWDEYIFGEERPATLEELYSILPLTKILIPAIK